MIGKKYSYSCIDEDELREAILAAAMKAEGVTGKKYQDIMKIYEGLIDELMKDDSGLVNCMAFSEDKIYFVDSSMMSDDSSIGHSQVKFQFMVMTNEIEWEDKEWRPYEVGSVLRVRKDYKDIKRDSVLCLAGIEKTSDKQWTLKLKYNNMMGTPTGDFEFVGTSKRTMETFEKVGQRN